MRLEGVSSWKELGLLPDEAAGSDGVICVEDPANNKMVLISVGNTMSTGGKVSAAKKAYQLFKTNLSNQYKMKSNLPRDAQASSPNKSPSTQQREKSERSKSEVVSSTSKKRRADGIFTMSKRINLLISSS